MSAPARGQQFLQISSEELPASRGLGHRILAGIAHLGHVRFYAGSKTAGARHNAGTEFRDIGLANFSGYRNRQQAILAGLRQVAQVRLHAGLDPAFAWLDAGA
jgi:hypothetical protein